MKARFLSTAIALCFSAGLLFGSLHAASAKDRIISNVSYDVCMRRLNRGQDCLYPYWYPFWGPDLAYRRPFKSFHTWPYFWWQ